MGVWDWVTRGIFGSQLSRGRYCNARSGARPTRRYHRGVRILHLESGRHLYGGARQVGNLIQGLARRGVENILVCPPEQPLAAMDLDARVVELKMSGDLDFALKRRLESAIVSTEPDVVHVHSRRGADSFAGFASRAAKRPAILTRRVDAPELGVWARFKYRPYARIVAISRAIEAELRDRVGLSSARLARVPSSVDAARFRPDADARAALLARFDLPYDTRIIGLVAQLIERKGHAFLLDCLPEIVARQPRARLLLFGRGPAESAIRSRVAALGLGDSVFLGGYDTAIERVLPGLDLLAHPASSEGLGSVILEAMSAGLTVVAADVGGIGDLIDTGVDGFRLPPRSREAWIEALATLAGDDPARARFGANARAKVERAFTIDAMTDAYLDIYRDVCR